MKLCGKHAAAVSSWAKVVYNPRKPGEWPDMTGGRGVMDSRTPHAERAQDWNRKTAAQIEMIKGFCRDNRNCGE